jgi:nucleoside-diphosphate-sugar epimerase
MGRPVVKELVARGHEVVGLTRSERGVALLRALGATGVAGDALDAEGLARALAAARPTHVVHLLTSIPPNISRSRDMEATNQLRIRGTANLIGAAIASGAKRLVAESFPTVYGIGDVSSQPLSETDPLLPIGPWASRGAVEALRSLESQMREARERGRIEAVVLRFGYLYGSNVPSTHAMMEAIRDRKMPVIRGDRGLGSFIHNDDVAAATIAALEAPEVSDVYNIVDDSPANFTDFVTFAAEQMKAPVPRRVPPWVLRFLAPLIAEIASSRLPLSNARARAELGWKPRFPSFREGLMEKEESARFLMRSATEAAG